MPGKNKRQETLFKAMDINIYVKNVTHCEKKEIIVGKFLPNYRRELFKLLHT